MASAGRGDGGGGPLPPGGLARRDRAGHRRLDGSARLTGSHGEPWGAMGSHGESWGVMGSHGESWGVMGSHGQPWGVMMAWRRPAGSTIAAQGGERYTSR